jgi:hypothetical protein
MYMSRRSWRKTRLFLLVSLPTLFIAFAILLYSYSLAIADYYAGMATAHLIIGYTEQSGEIPSSWEELHELKSERLEPLLFHYGFQSCTEIQERVLIDFQVLDFDFQSSCSDCVIKSRMRGLLGTDHRTANGWLRTRLTELVHSSPEEDSSQDKPEE